MLLSHLRIENYRGIKLLELALDETTVLVGENNSGKTTVLHALRACLNTLRATGRAPPFDDFDLHFDNSAADPTSAPPISITLTFEESEPGTWSDEIDRQLGGDGGVVVLVAPDDRSRIQLRVTASFSKITQEVDTGFDFLDASGKPLPQKNRGRLSALQQLRPLFYLSALRDAGKEFSRTAQFWSPFVKNSQIDAATKAEIEEQLQAINAQIIEAHGTFKEVREHLSKVQALVALGEKDVVSVEAVPARVFDMLNRTQVSIASVTGARLPIARHGEGTQSLAVLMLFDAFLKSELARKQGVKESAPIVALEEPEAHLHPNAVRALWKTIAGINGQKLIATHSGDLLSEVDIHSVRRLYRGKGGICVGYVPKGLFDERESQKFDYWVRRTRGELYFARCWLLVEGETDVILLTGGAKASGIDLEQAGVRIIDYAQSDLGIFIKAADSLGIGWHVFSDGDASGAKNVAKATSVLDGRDDVKHITLLPNGEPIEPWLCRSGFMDVYEEHASDQNRPRYITVGKDDPAYAGQLFQCLPKNGKPSAAHAVVSVMLKRGASSVPGELKACLTKAISLALEV